jgi:hypothetical protein
MLSSLTVDNPILKEIDGAYTAYKGFEPALERRARNDDEKRSHNQE